MPAAGVPDATSRTWQVRKPLPLPSTLSNNRSQAILWTWANASARSSSKSPAMRRSSAAKMTRFEALRTARMNGKPNLAV